MTRIYIGYKAGTMEIFRSSTCPTFETHGHLYPVVIGPFKTMRGAKFMQTYGKNNPHCQCVRDAERFARQLLAVSEK